MIKSYIILLLLIYSSVKCQYSTLIEYSYKFAGNTKGIALASQTDNVFFLTKHDRGDISYEQIMNNNSLINIYHIFKYNKINNKIIHNATPNFNVVVVQDSIAVPEWKILDGKKEILGYNCSKAETTFRGRKWTVWFTTEISNTIFPWKLSGLPGAILEADENDNVFSIKALRVVDNGNFKLPKLIEHYPYLESYLEKDEKPKDYEPIANQVTVHLKELQNKGIADLPKGAQIVEIPHYRYGELEKSFEWEKEEPKKP